MKDFLKIGLIGGAALFFLKDQIASLFTSQTPATQPPPSTPAAQPQATNPPAATPPAATPPTTTNPSPLIAQPSPVQTAPVTPLPDASGYLPLTIESYMRAAGIPTIAPRLPLTVQFNGDQWNWYRNAYLRSQGEPERDFGAPETFLPPGSPRDMLMTAVQYHAFRSQAGLGMIQRASWGRSGAWS